MEKRELTKALKEIQKRTGIDFVRSDFGHCCQTCADFRDQKVEEAFYKAETYLIAKYYKSGMNHHGAFDTIKELALGWNYDEKLHPIVEEELSKYFKVEMPEDHTDCIIIREA